MDEVDLDVPSKSENVAENAQPPAATLPPEAPALPEAEMQPDDQFTEDFAAATHLPEISDEMAEMLFSADPESSADPATSATGVFEAVAPLGSDEIGEAIERTAVVEQMNEDDDSEPAPPPAANTLVF